MDLLYNGIPADNAAYDGLSSLQENLSPSSGNVSQDHDNRQCDIISRTAEDSLSIEPSNYNATRTQTRPTLQHLRNSFCFLNAPQISISEIREQKSFEEPSRLKLRHQLRVDEHNLSILRRYSDTTLGRNLFHNCECRCISCHRKAPCLCNRHHSCRQTCVHRNNRSPASERKWLEEIGADYLRINGAVAGFKQLKRVEETSTLSNTKPDHTSSRISVLFSQNSSLDLLKPGNTTSLTALHQNLELHQSITSLYSRQKTQQTLRQQKSKNVGYRLGRRRQLYEKRKKISDYALYFALFGIIVMILETELSLADLYQKNSTVSYIARSLISISTVFLIGLILAYHATEIQLFSIDNCIDDWRIAITMRRVAQTATEVIIAMIHPVPYYYILKLPTYMVPQNKWITADVPLDIILSLPMFLRLYLIFRVMLLHSKLFTDSISRSIGALNRINFDTQFVLKTLMTICPGTMLLVFILSLWIIGSWLMRACECFHEPIHGNLLNSMWLVAVTFLSIGYGDLAPHTYCGKVIAIAVGVMGSACTALVVAVFARKLELTRAEKHVHNFMMDTQLTKRLKNAAANVLRETWFIYKYTKLVKRVNGEKVRRHQRKFLQAIHSLRKVKRDQRKLNDNANTLVDLAKTQTNICETVTDIKHEQECLRHRISNIEDKLMQIHTDMDNLPQAISNVIQHNYEELFKAIDYNN